jgi:hypothetical protein
MVSQLGNVTSRMAFVMHENASAPDHPVVKFRSDTRSRLMLMAEVTADILDEFERLASEFASRSRETFAVPRADRQNVQLTDMASVVRLFVGLFRHGVYLRHAALAVDFIEATNRRRVFGVALFGRAILETAAASAYHFKAILEGARAMAEPPHDSTRFNRAMFQAVAGSRFDWQRDDRRRESRPLFLDEFEKSVKGTAFGEAANVLTMLDALREGVEKRAPGSSKLVGHAYGKLSDICHPAFGGCNAVFGSAEVAALEVSSAHAVGHAIVVAREILPVLVLGSNVSLDRLKRLEAFATWGESAENDASM